MFNQNWIEKFDASHGIPRKANEQYLPAYQAFWAWASDVGQAVLKMRLDGVNEPEIPCFVLIDKAYQLNVSEVKRISGIGRGRGVSLGLGYQDLPQMYDQYGKEQANAILGTVMTKIFLPGLDDVTAEYASKQLGETTIFAKTYQDFPGKKNDNIRYAEQKRSLMLGSEVRQIAAHKELLIVNDTAPPIKAAYPPLAVLKQKYISPEYGKSRVFYLGDIDEKFKFAEKTHTSDVHLAKSPNNEDFNRTNIDDEKLDQILDETLAKVINEKTIFEKNEEIKMNNLNDPSTKTPDIAFQIGSANSENVSENTDQTKLAPVILTKTYQAEEEMSDEADALDNLSEDVRLGFRELDAHAEMELDRGIV